MSLASVQESRNGVDPKEDALHTFADALDQASTTEQERATANLTRVIKLTFLAAFTYIFALSVRDAFQQTMTYMIPRGSSLILTYLYTTLVLLVLLIMAYSWQDLAVQELTV